MVNICTRTTYTMHIETKVLVHGDLEGEARKYKVEE